MELSTYNNFNTIALGLPCSFGPTVSDKMLLNIGPTVPLTAPVATAV